MTDSRQPNILFIMADQMAGPAMPFHGNPIVQAPNLSALAQGGVVFDSAYCSSPLCAPSRFSLMAGQLPSRIGAYDNAAEFAASVPTFAHYLRAQGYRTCLAGKMHFVGPDQLHGFEERLTTDIYPSDFGWTPDWERPEHRFSWYHNMLSVVQAGRAETTNQLDYDEEVAFHAVRKIYEMARDGDGRPFCLTVSFTHPHDPYAITRGYWDRYEHAAINLPAVPPISDAELDPHSRRIRRVCAMDQYALTDERVRNARHAYYAMISYVDDKVGQLLGALRGAGFADDTVVLFASDHGDMLGERGLWYKMVFFEWSARVPLIFYAPGRFAPRRVAEPVSLMDLLPTLVELAGGAAGPEPLADRVDGHSLIGWLQGGQPDHPGLAASEYLAEGALAPIFMLRQGPYKYVYSQADPEQLYDLETDPLELRNLAERGEYERARQALRAQALSRWDAPRIREEVLASQRRRRLLARALMAGRHRPWDFQPRRDASQQYMRGHLDLDMLERTARFPAVPTPPPDGPLP
jgi:choline-sulfatase